MCGKRVVRYQTREKNDHMVASRRRWLEHKDERVALQERWQYVWQDISSMKE